MRERFGLSSTKNQPQPRPRHEPRRAASSEERSAVSDQSTGHKGSSRARPGRSWTNPPPCLTSLGWAGNAASQGMTTVTVGLLPPVPTLSAPARESIARTHVVTLTLSSDTDATFVAHGTLTVPGAARVFKLRGLTGTLAANTPRTIQLGLSVRQVAAVKLALKHHRKVTALATVRVRNGGGPTTVTRTIRAKR